MVIKKIVNKIKILLAYFQYIYSKRFRKDLDIDIFSVNFERKLPDIQQQYNIFHHYFWNNSPTWLKTHRGYFIKNQRGFGDDAFHSMWYFILRKYRPINLLEIGVYRGQVISLWSLISEKLSKPYNIHGISPFLNVGDNVSEYIDIDYMSDVKENFKQLNLILPTLHTGYSTDGDMIDFIKSKKWDLIYIDGSHDYDIVKQDFELCASSLSQKGIIVLDDSALYTSYKPSLFASAGHPGPSLVAAEIDSTIFTEILSIGHNRVFQLISK
jgi:hypothetical protein